MDRPIPAFYCCYLLRSTVRHAALYVGSTPNPVRRLKQHNGESKGGAVRTSRDTLRPWEMTCIVTGFPSKIAALQFEWAWQNTHLTRRIPTEDRITRSTIQVRTNPRTGKTRKRPKRPRATLSDKLANLHLLLRVKSFERWPLSVRFFAEDVWKAWEKWIGSTPFKLRDGVVILERPHVLEVFKRPGKQAKERNDVTEGKGVEAIDATYQDVKSHLEKSISLLEDGKRCSCAICKKQLKQETELAVVCPEKDCSTVSHMTCLSQAFLQEEENRTAILPLAGHCPGCGTNLQWSTLTKDLSLRMRGQKEVASLFKKRRTKAATAAEAAAAVQVEASNDGDDAVPENEADIDDSEDDLPLSALPRGLESQVGGNSELEDSGMLRADVDDLDDFAPIEEFEDDQLPADAAASAGGASKRTSGKSVEIVIEDSDWDEEGRALD